MMRLLERNKTPFKYLSLITKTDVVDNFGNMTGEKRLVYGQPVDLRGHISKAGGEASVEMFGTNINYDKTILLDINDARDIDENTVLFIDKPVEYDSNNIPLYDYKVVKIATTLNITAIAVEKVR